MTEQWKRDFANKAEHAIQHELVQQVIDEQLMNLGREDDRLARYGLNKIAQYAATVARAEALGIDPEALRTDTMDEEDIRDWMGLWINAAHKADVPIWIVTESDDEGDS